MPQLEIIIHHIDHVKTAIKTTVELAIPVTIVTPPGGVDYAGVSYYVQLFDCVRKDMDEFCIDSVIDCGAHAGWAMAALRIGAKKIRFLGRESVSEKLSSIARDYNARIIGEVDAQQLDLLNKKNHETICHQWLCSFMGAERIRCARAL